MRKINLFLIVLTAALSVVVFPEISWAQKDARCNCVIYARQHVRSLPTGLYETPDKLRIVNSMFPRPGTVAIFNYNHVAVVRNVQVASDGSLIVSIDEANYKPCQYGSRRGTMASLQIAGFFDPRFNAGNTPPQVPNTTLSGSPGREFYANIYGTGFDPSSVQLILLGGNYCVSWGRCTVPTSVIGNRTSGTLKAPLTINSPGRYSVYVYNARDGRSSNAIPVTITASADRIRSRPRR